VAGLLALALLVVAVLFTYRSGLLHVLAQARPPCAIASL
jgi:hypothetical protein